MAKRFIALPTPLPTKHQRELRPGAATAPIVSAPVAVALAPITAGLEAGFDDTEWAIGKTMELLTIAQLLQASTAFQTDMADILAAGPEFQTDTDRLVVSVASAVLSVEHGVAARVCFASVCPQSATALMRLQYEATVRSAWALFAASEEEIEVLSRQLDDEADRAARKSPGANEMLKAMDGKSPPGLLVPLHQFHVLSWHGLNSYIHAGIHPIRRISEGFPEQLARQLIINSNGMLHLAYRLLASLTGSQPLLDAITQAGLDHSHCLPLT